MTTKRMQLGAEAGMHGRPPRRRWPSALRLIFVGAAALAAWLPHAHGQAIGDGVDLFLTTVGAGERTSTGEGVVVYDVGTLTMTTQVASDLLIGVTLEGTFDASGIAMAASVLAQATGYGAGIEPGIASFLETRSSDLAGAGPVIVRVEAYQLVVDLVEGMLGTGGTLQLVLPRIDPARFGPPAATLGPADATVVVREFSDFQCPFCQRFAFDLLPGLKEDLLSRGTVRFEFHHLPLETIHANAVPAAEAAQCVADLHGDAAFWAYHDLVFARQAAWQNLGDPYPFLERLLLDVDPDVWGATSAATARSEVAACLEQGDARATVQEAMSLARELQISATPTVYVGGLKLTDFGSSAAYDRAIRLEQAIVGEQARGQGAGSEP